MSWAARATHNLLPLSREQDRLEVALKEWRYTGHHVDLEEPAADCELCDHPDIRYQFEIKNLHTGNELLVGSECISRFNIVATDSAGRSLDVAETRAMVARDRRKLVEDARKKRSVSALVALAFVDKQFEILSFVSYLGDRGAFTPNQPSILLWRLEKYRIKHNPRDFRLTIRRSREKAQLTSMPAWKLNRLRSCLSTAQLAFLDRQASSIHR